MLCESSALSVQIANELLGEVRAQVGMLDRIDNSTTGANDMLKSSMAKFSKACFFTLSVLAPRGASSTGNLVYRYFQTEKTAC